MFEVGDYVKCVDDKPKYSRQRAIWLKAGNIYRVTAAKGDLISVDGANNLFPDWWNDERFVVSKSVPDNPYALDIIDV